MTMGYGLRNVASIPRALEELGRVLKPGAKAAILDFNNSDSPVVDSFQVCQEHTAVPLACALGCMKLVYDSNMHAEVSCVCTHVS